MGTVRNFVCEAVRVATALLVCLGLSAFSPLGFAQTSPLAPAAGPRAPAFEYLGTLQAETDTRTVVENGLTGP